MTPNEQGRFCDTCAKTVVDFSVMSDEAVREYFFSNHGKQICGHFKNSQVQRIRIDLPENIFSIPLAPWKKFFIAFLIIYGSNFLSVDITIAGISHYRSNTFYEKLQDAPIIKKKKKKTHRKKKSELNIIERKIDIIDFELDGLVSLPKIKNWCKTPDTNEITVSPISPKNKDGNTNKSEYSLADKNKPWPPAKKPQPEKIEYILPVTIALRNPFSKKKKA